MKEPTRATRARSNVRLAALALIVACSSSTKQPEQAPPPATQPAAPAAAGSDDPWTPKPADPAAEQAALRADVDIMCGAAKATGGTTFIDVGPYIAENMKTGHKVALFADVRTRTLDEMIERMRALAAKANVTTCD